MSGGSISSIFCITISCHNKHLSLFSHMVQSSVLPAALPDLQVAANRMPSARSPRHLHGPVMTMFGVCHGS